MKAPKPSNEKERLETLYSYQILDTLPEQAFDDLTRIAAQICGAPVALVSLMDDERQWFKAKVGMEDSETSRDIAFCSYAINDPDHVLEVTDAAKDERFMDNPLVTGESASYQFYAGAPLVVDQKYALGTICVLDVKPRKLSDEQLHSLQALSRQVVSQLKLRVQVERERKLARQQKKMNEERSHFLSNMSHEIRTPLNAIVGSLSLLKFDNLSNEQQELLNIMKFSSENLMALVNDILDVDKLDSNKIRLESAPVRIKELLRSIQQVYGIRAEEKGIKLFFSIDEAAPDVVLGDSVRIAQIMNNLVCNAVKFTEKGGVRVILKLVSKKPKKVNLNFVVRDTGIGISKEQQEHLFKRFKQADQSTTRKYGGSGLGLYITKNLIDMMGSSIYLVSELGEGTTFSFNLSLPIVQEGTFKEKPKAVLSEKMLSGKILLVDDNQLNRVLLSKFLEKWGLQCDEAVNGLDAVEKVKGNKYDLVLMDLHMPEMDGYTASEQIRAMDGNYFKSVPIVAVTASVMDVKGAVEKSGMQDFILKPFTALGLQAMIEKYVTSSDEVQETQSATAVLENAANGSRRDELKKIIFEYTEGDPEFSKELAGSFELNFIEIKEESKNAIMARDVNLYNEVIHKVKPSCEILQYNEFYAELIQMKTQLSRWKEKKNLQRSDAIFDEILEDLKDLF